MFNPNPAEGQLTGGAQLGSMEPQKLSQTQKAVTSLSNEIGQLEKELEALFQRLLPVLVKNVSDTEKECCPPQESFVPLASEIRTQAERINRINRGLMILRGRIEV
jgi:hypothetical protein